MSPEERAEDTLREIERADVSLMSWHSRAMVAEAIRQAENDALERAANLFERQGRIGTAIEVRSLMLRQRSKNT